MAKRKQLTKRQLAVIEDLFSGELDEQAVLDKHKVSRNVYNKWLAEASFTEQFDQRIAAAYCQSAALIARYAPLAAAKLVQLTESDKEETARKACLDIISVPHQLSLGSRLIGAGKTQASSEPPAPNPSPDTSGGQAQQLSDQTARKLLAILAEERDQDSIRVVSRKRPDPKK